MQPDTVCKTVRQYSSDTLSQEEMEMLREVAEDYRRVKNYVYERYGGKGGLSKIYPGYTVQNEMTKSGLRTELGLPSVYFYLAVFEALGDIKTQWTRTKARVQKLIGQNENLTREEKHYLRFLLKASNAFEAVLNEKEIRLPGEMQQKLDAVTAGVDAGKLHRYLRRQVRKYHVSRLHTQTAGGFSATERAYRYGDHGIYISTKQNRKRVFVPLTDNNRYESQIYVRLLPERGRLEISVPIQVSVRNHEDYSNEVGLAVGIFTMLTTDQGHCYGENLGELQTEYAQWVRERTAAYNRSRRANPGRKKYNEQKRRYQERIHGYINQELNRFFRTEKPGRVYLVKLPAAQAGGVNRKINQGVTLWQRGYIRSRLALKCRENGAELVDVLGKDISKECSSCGGAGEKRDGTFTCTCCGQSIEEKVNTARNVLKRGREGKRVNK
nr:zinc ribbon domain-containing protein [uncultured Acetatifactor sp.]